MGMKHRPISVLLKRKRLKLGESLAQFGERFFNWKSKNVIGLYYGRIERLEMDFPESKIPIASKILRISRKRLMLM